MIPYAHKLVQRAEGIWKGLGLSLMKQDCDEHDGVTSLVFRFYEISPAQAELLVSQMAKAFRRANIYWKQDDGLKVCVDIPPM